MYAHKESEFFSRYYIEGAVDSVVGITGQAWLQGCTLAALRAKGGLRRRNGRAVIRRDYMFLIRAEL